MEISLSDELICLESSYDASEFLHFSSSQSHVLKFIFGEDICLIFTIHDQYPQAIPNISVSSRKFSNAQKNRMESDLKNFAEGLIGSYMIMDLVTKFQEIYESYQEQCVLSEQSFSQSEDNYMAVILIDHIRQRNKYLKALSSWASDFSIFGGVIFCHKWIFLIIQGTRKNVKKYIIQHRASCIDVDSSGRPCKEKMSTILYEGNCLISLTSFSVEELSTLKDLEEYLRSKNLESIFQDIIKPVVSKN